MTRKSHRLYESVDRREFRNPNGVDLSCHHCGSRDLHYKIVTEFEVFVDTEGDDIRVYEREPGDTREYDSIWCCSCGKRAFSRARLEALGVNVPI